MRWIPVLATAAVLAAAVVGGQLLPRNDFAPFTMRIEWYALSPGYSGSAELRYVNRSDWQIHNPSDEYVYACNDGLYGHFERTGAFVITNPAFAYPCPGPDRWIAYGAAWAVKSGFPLMYEAGPPGSAPAQRTVYTFVK